MLLHGYASVCSLIHKVNMVQLVVAMASLLLASMVVLSGNGRRLWFVRMSPSGARPTEDYSRSTRGPMVRRRDICGADTVFDDNTALGRDVEVLGGRKRTNRGLYCNGGMSHNSSPTGGM